MTDLSEREIQILQEALDDEYRAWATYDQVIADFGEVRPFINIRESEARHIDALRRLFERYALPVPGNPWVGRAARYASVKRACEAGVAAEIANGEMYERLLSATRRPDIVDVLRNLQEASQERHLPAFKRGAERSEGGGGRGQGRRHRGGRGGD
jgi:hypothetical protein